MGSLSSCLQHGLLEYIATDFEQGPARKNSRLQISRRGSLKFSQLLALELTQFDPTLGCHWIRALFEKATLLPLLTEYLSLQLLPHYEVVAQIDARQSQRLAGLQLDLLLALGLWQGLLFYARETLPAHCHYDVNRLLCLFFGCCNVSSLL